MKTDREHSERGSFLVTSFSALPLLPSPFRHRQFYELLRRMGRYQRRPGLQTAAQKSFFWLRARGGHLVDERPKFVSLCEEVERQ